MTGRSRLTRLGSVAALAVLSLVLGGCALSLQSLPKPSGISTPTYPVRAVFANVLNLPTEAQVRVGAEVVGQVGAITTKDFHADLTLDIKRGVRLPRGTTAQIRFDNPLGDEYVLLTAPPTLTSAPDHRASAYLAPGSLIPVGSTSTAPSVEDTFGALSLVLNGGGINQLETIIRELNNTLGPNHAPIRSFLTTIDNGVSSLSNGRASIDGALASISNLTQKLNGGGSTIANGINTLAPAIGVLSSENGQISDLISELSKLGAIGTTVARQSGQNSVDDAKDLLPVVQQLESITAQLTPDLRDLALFEAESPKLAPGSYLQVSAMVNVFLPSGSFDVTPPSELPAARAQAPAAGPGPARAVSDLLTAGLS